ncbi:hypothetical protein [Mesorhizobium xinjiangense]|uniref:hypothetical protein n=1 Tax=Mesorhizobium xinjiangense TaxID=2678685 RepID=UPI0012EDA8B8|nr:hypothetical protein [Mesorhizobium xinjiangense]
MVSDLNRHRRAFWAQFASEQPALAARMERGSESTRWLAVGNRPLILAHYISANAVGLFVRGDRGTRTGHIREFLFPHHDLLAAALGQPDIRLGDQFLLVSRLRTDMHDKANWPNAIDWLAGNSPIYERALRDLQRL